MQNRTLLAALATAAAVAFVAPSVSHAQVPQTSKGEVATAPNFGSLMSALNSASAQNTKIQALTEINAANVQLVDVEPLLKGNNAEALKAALTKNEADVTALRTSLGANKGLNDVITASTTPTLTAADVIAADVGPDGKVFI